MSTGEQGQSLGAGDVCARLGISHRQLDNWCHSGLIEGHDTPPGSGRARLFTQAQVERVRAIRDALSEATRILSDAGIPLPFNLREMHSHAYTPAGRSK